MGLQAKLDQRIRVLYVEKFCSASIIATKLSISLDSVYRSLVRQNITRRDAVEQNRIRFENKPLSFFFKEKLSSSEKDLLVAALMLYAGEGAKTQTTVDFANSDPRVLKVFLKFLRIICRIDEGKLRFYLYCFEGQNNVKLIEFWAKELKVKKNLFTKPYIRPARPDLKRLMPYGVLHIRYSDKKLLQKILFLIDKIINELS